MREMLGACMVHGMVFVDWQHVLETAVVADSSRGRRSHYLFCGIRHSASYVWYEHTVITKKVITVYSSNMDEAS